MNIPGMSNIALLGKQMPGKANRAAGGDPSFQPPPYKGQELRLIAAACGLAAPSEPIASSRS